MTMVHPLSQPLNLRVKGLPSVTSYALLRNAGFAATAATRAERKAREYFMVGEES